MKNMIASRLIATQHIATERRQSLKEVTNQATNQTQTKKEERGEVKMKFIQRLLKLKIKGNEKGMTLIELLGVIVILGIVAVIAIPAIGNLITSSERKAQAANAHMLVDSARHYISATGFTATAGTPTLQEISVETLVSKGFLDGIPKDPYDKATTYGSTTSVRVTRTTTDATNVADQVDTYKFSVYIADSLNTVARVGTFVSKVPVEETDLDISNKVNKK